MKRVIEDLLGMLRYEPLHPLTLTTYCPSDLDSVLQLLPSALSACGGWLLRQLPSSAGVARAVFECERSTLIDMYAALARLGLLLDRSSELALIQTCQCARYAQTSTHSR